MTDEQFNNFVGQLSHVGWACLIVTWITLLCPAYLWYLLGISVGLAALKEFWFDMRYESPVESGGFWGSVQDFSFYCLGAGIAILAVYLRGLI